MKKTDREIIIDKLSNSGKFSVFNGEMFFKSKGGWKSITQNEMHLYNDILKHIQRDGWDYNDISVVEKSIERRTVPINIKTNACIYTPNYFIDLEEKGYSRKLTDEEKDSFNLSIGIDPVVDMEPVEWWDKMLSKALNGEEDAITAYYEMIGLSMITDKKHEVSYWITGKAGTGKSTIVNSVLEGIHHRRNVSHLEPNEWSSNSPFFYTMANKLVNISSDNANEKSLETGAFKKMASGEKVSANIKFKNPIEFVPTALLISIGNSMPIIKESTDGPYRRMIMLNMNNKIDKNDKNINIKKEIVGNKDRVLDYIVFKALDAVTRLYESPNNEPTKPQMSRDSIREQKMFNDNAYEFFIVETAILDELFKTCLENTGLNWKEIFKEYKDWCTESNSRSYGRNNFIKHAKRAIEEENLPYKIKNINNKEYLFRAEANNE